MDPPASSDRRPATPEEARALANPLRLRILRLCLDRALTNKQVAERLGRDPGTILHHVRMLVATGFLVADGERRGARGAVERPYRATRKSWTLDVGERASTDLAIVDAFRGELAEVQPSDIHVLTRLGVRLRPKVRDAFSQRLAAIAEELAVADDPDGEPCGLLLAMHAQPPVPIPERPRGGVARPSAHPAPARDGDRSAH
jgi:DNA-binding transcriptional ArsR family regulator